MDYLNRELSWIDFNERVLMEACSDTVPLLERLKFIGIVSSNFDEFFMVRVAGLQEYYKSGHHAPETSPLPAEELLESIVQKTRHLFNIQEAVLNTEILPQLKRAGLVYCKPEDCSPAQQQYLADYFYRHIYPMLEPQRSDDEQALVDSVVNVQLHLAFLLSDNSGGKDNLAIVPVPDLPRFIFPPDELLSTAVSADSLYGDGYSEPQQVHNTADPYHPKQKTKNTKRKVFVLLDELIRFYGSALFSGCTITGTGIFKINRSASMTVDDSSDDGFIEALEEILIRRRYSFVVRMTSTHESSALVQRLTDLFQLNAKDVYLSKAPIGLSSFAKIAETDGFKRLRNEKWEHFPHPLLTQHGTLWESIKAHDILLHVPYQSYKPVIRLLSDAAQDPDVLSIQMTLYRTSKTSPVVQSLIEAAKQGKKVTVFVELKARFDEERNLGWVKRLQKHGVRVVYDLPHLKVHAKLLLIMRKEAQGEQGYVHLSTGNYNDTTARLYVDLSLFTINPRMVEDAKIIFSRLCGKYTQENPQHIITAPERLKYKLLAYIEREIHFALEHKPARIIAKMNSLSHPELITALYRASQAGVHIDLNVRGICMLIPGRKDVSENIRVISIIDRYLEHSRIFYFENGGTPEWFLSSADWMPRNLERRVELLFPVLDPANQALLAYFLKIYFSDTVKAFEMQPDGSWMRLSAQKGSLPLRAQAVFHHFFEKKQPMAVITANPITANAGSINHPPSPARKL